jgi:beta-N-acetylhexosaminidase
MEAAKKIGDAVTRAEKALSAGCDMVLVCNAPQSALQVAEYLEAIEHPGNPGLAKLRGAPSSEIASLFETEKWATAAEAAGRLSE